MNLTHLFSPLYSFLCISFSAATFSNLAYSQAALNDDPFSQENVYSLTPRIVHPAPTTEYLSPKVTELKSLETPSFFSTPIEFLPDDPTELIKLPIVIDTTKPNDKIYDISTRFPNIKTGDQQWVHYNIDRCGKLAWIF